MVSSILPVAVAPVAGPSLATQRHHNYTYHLGAWCVNLADEDVPDIELEIWPCPLVERVLSVRFFSASRGQQARDVEGIPLPHGTSLGDR